MDVHTIGPDCTIICGEAVAALRELPAEGVDCCVTSPPYWGLRDYGTGTWVGGDVTCDHEAARKKTRYDYSLATSPVQNGARTGTDAQPHMFAEVCPTCGAKREDAQLGLEVTPDEYVARMADVFDEVRRVLKPSGTLFLNIGDSYSERQLTGVPWRLAFELQSRGWWLRSDIIWAKSQVMPESCTDRPTKSHEHVFLLTKGSDYFWDHEAAQEQAQWERWGRQTQPKGAGWIAEKSKAQLSDRDTRNVRDVWFLGTAAYPDAHFAVMPEELAGICLAVGCPKPGVVIDPFAGTGTTALVARRYGQASILIELSPAHVDQARVRLAQQSLFAA